MPQLNLHFWDYSISSASLRVEAMTAVKNYSRSVVGRDLKIEISDSYCMTEEAIQAACTGELAKPGKHVILLHISPGLRKRARETLSRGASGVALLHFSQHDRLAHSVMSPLPQPLAFEDVLPEKWGLMFKSKWLPYWQRLRDFA